MVKSIYKITNLKNNIPKTQIAKKYNMSKTRVYQTIARYKRVVTNRFRFQKINEYNFIHNYKKKGE